MAKTATERQREKRLRDRNGKVIVRIGNDRWELPEGYLEKIIRALNAWGVKK